jgi:FKBP-type peptidyl-prolyl cis-trans isomerase 2
MIGSKDVIPGLSQGLLGKRAGEQHTIAVPPDQGFGKFHPELVQTLPRLFLREKVAVGDQLAAEVNGAALEIWVQKIYSGEVVLDANHPLAGETLLIDVDIVHVAPAAERQNP